MSDKKSLLKEIIPKAVLKAKTAEAKHSIRKSCMGKGMIGIWEFPVRIGRESRVEPVKGEEAVVEEQNRDISKPHNDIYLLDSGSRLQISREHLLIEKDESGYLLKDRNSACGTMINDEVIGGHKEGGNHVLKDGDIISIGAEQSPYQFEFILLEEI